MSSKVSKPYPKFHRQYVLVLADKAAKTVVVVCRLIYINTLKQCNATKQELSGEDNYLREVCMLKAT